MRRDGGAQFLRGGGGEERKQDAVFPRSALQEQGKKGKRKRRRKKKGVSGRLGSFLLSLLMLRLRNTTERYIRHKKDTMAEPAVKIK